MTYFLLLLNTLLIELAMNLPIGSLPLVLQSEGALRNHITLAMGAGMAVSVLVAIPIGAFVDRVGRTTTMKAAIAIAALTLIALGYTHGALPGGILMGFRSVAMVSFMTAQAAYISLLVPEERSVSAVATVGIMGNLAFACSPALSVWLWQHGWARDQFLAGTAVLVLAGISMFFLPAESRKQLAHDGHKQVIMRKEWFPPMIFGVCGAMQAGVNASLAVLAFHDRGIANGAILFSASALTSVVFRYFAGRAVERFGSRAIAVPTAIVQALGCYLSAGATDIPTVIASGVCLGIGWAAIVPVILGLLFEQSAPQARGAAMGAFHFAFGLGAALGAGVATLTTSFGNGYGQAMDVCVVMPFLALAIVLLVRYKPQTFGRPSVVVLSVEDPTPDVTI